MQADDAPDWAYRLFVHSGYACTRATYECMMKMVRSFSCMRGGLRDGCAQGLIESGEPSEMKRVNRPPNARRDERGESWFCREPGFWRGASLALCEANLGVRRQERGGGLSTICKLWK